MKSLDTENKVWICDNLEWMIDTLGHEDFYKRSFFESTVTSLQVFHENEVFSLDNFCSYLSERLELKENFVLEVFEGEEPKMINGVLFISNPATSDREDNIFITRAPI